MKVPRQTGRQREGATDRQTRSRARAHTHTHTHGHRDRGRVTERRQTGDRQGREDGIGSETDTLAQTVTHLRGRPRGSSSFPKGGGVSLGPGPAGRLKAVPWGWRSPVETPRLPRLQGPIRLGYLKRDPAPAPRPEGECVRVCVCVCVCVCVSVSVGEGGVGSTWGRMDTQSGGGRVWTPPAWEACVVLLLSLSPSFSVSLTCGFQLLNCLGGGVYLPKPKATFSGDVVKGQCTLTHLIYPKILDMSGLRL